MNLTAGSGGTLKLTACEGRVPETEPIQGVRTPHGRFKPDVPLKDFLQRYAEIGGSHHGTLGYGRHAETIEKVAWILGLAFERI
jgi:L-arabinose isomerase